MKNTFRSRDFTFRPTTLSAAMQKAGLIDAPTLVREAKREGLLRAKQDNINVLPSVRIEPIQSDVRKKKKAAYCSWWG